MPDHPQPSTNLQDTPHSRGFALALLGLLTLSIIGFGAIGRGGPLEGRLVVIAGEVVFNGWMPMVYMLSAYGFGCLLARYIPVISGNHALKGALGLALMLWITHLLGTLGLLNEISAWIITAIGAALCVVSLRSNPLRMNLPSDRASRGVLAMIVVGIGLLIVAASSPPGSLWDSEFGAYDSLSYHLELPKEWISDGRIWPKEHNVYSFHPGYIESAYVHLAMLGGRSITLQSAQFFSLLMILLAACNCARATNEYAGHDSRLPGLVAASLVVLTPWVVVVGTMSYNEPGAIVFGGGALAVICTRSISPAMRGLLCGLLVGAACSCKLTAIYFLAPSIAALLFARTPVRSWRILILPGLAASAAMIMPWTIRNMIASGNPVFPHLAGIFGSGHWSSEQLARFAAAHHFDGTLMDRLAMIALPDPDASPLIHVARFRGLSNIQWGLFPAAVILMLAWLLMKRPTHRLGALLVLAFGLPMIAWIFATHLQSRFFLPMVPLGACVVGFGCTTIHAQRPAAALLAMGSLVFAGGLFAGQRSGHPNELLTIGAAVYTDPLNMDGQAQSLTWSAGLNAAVDSSETVYLLGDATPMYLRPRVVYNTTYDTPIVAGLIEMHPNDPPRWVDGLANQGIDWVIVNTSELARLDSSGWLDPRISPHTIGQLTDTLHARALGGGTIVVLDPARTAYRIKKPIDAQPRP